MSDPGHSENRPPKRVLFLAALVVGLAAWLVLGKYTSSGARDCLALYRAARTAADTARVDTTVAQGGRTEQDPRSCGSLRTASRWQ